MDYYYEEMKKIMGPTKSLHSPGFINTLGVVAIATNIREVAKVYHQTSFERLDKRLDELGTLLASTSLFTFRADLALKK